VTSEHVRASKVGPRRLHEIGRRERVRVSGSTGELGPNGVFPLFSLYFFFFLFCFPFYFLYFILFSSFDFKTLISNFAPNM
jgi:hypothetical protein